MPRKPEAELEERILNAAYKLWAKGGEQALTMRAVAKAARTTTPTLYDRFRDKQQLLSEMRARAQHNLYCAIKPAKSIAEACQLAIDYTLGHGHEYELVASNWAARLSGKEPTPSLDLIQERLAEQLGGASGDHVQLALALAMLYHGASMLLLGEGVRRDVAGAIRSACIAATDALVSGNKVGVLKAAAPGPSENSER